MRVYGNGSVQQVDKGSRYKCRRWRLFVKTEDGMRTRRVDGTLREAQAALPGFVAELEAEVACADTFASYADRWQRERKASGELSPNTVERDAGRIEALKRVFGKLALSDLTPATVRTGLIELKNGRNASGKVLSGTTMNGLHTCLGQVLSQAVDDGLIADNPCRVVKRPKRDTKEKDAVGRDGLSEMLDRLDAMQIDGRVMAVYLMATLGLRRGEACGLYWEDVGEDTVTIRRAMREADGSIDKPKTAAGVRELPMPPRLKRKMAEWREASREYGYTGDAVCRAVNGEPLRPQNLWKWWEAHRAELGMEGITLHQLRHSNLTIMARNCRSAFDLQRWAGWSSIEPARIYIHRDDDALRSAASMLDL